MRFDPAADPWGTAMLAAAALWLLALLVLLAATLARTPRRTGGLLMMVSLLAFLVAAVGGTWVRIQRADAIASQPPPPPPEQIIAKAVVDPEPPPGDAEPAATSGPTDDGDGPQTRGSGEPAAASTGEPAAASTGRDEPGTSEGTDEGTTRDAADPGSADPRAPEPAAPEPAAPEPAAPEPAAPEPAAPEPTEPAAPEPIAGPSQPVIPDDRPKVEPLPTDPRAREAAIADILADAAKAAGDGKRCGNLERVARAWARIQQVPVTRKAKSITTDLETCRRRLLYSISQKRLGEMTEARDEWYAKLPTKIRKQHGLIIQSNLSGGSHQRLRIGHPKLDAAQADALMDAGLRDDLLRLEFAHVVISNGKKAKTFELPVTPHGELGLPWLRAVGLGEPLRLAEP